MAQADSNIIPPRLPLAILPGNRDDSTKYDARLVNCYLETNKQTGEVFIYRRPGLLTFYTTDPVAIGLGCWQWDHSVYSVFGQTLYRDQVSVATSPAFVTDGDTKVYFNSMLGATPKLMLSEGHHAYTYNTGTGLSAELHTINIEYPDDTVKGIVYVNGAIYVMQPQAVIWGSKINSVDQVGDWDPLDFISAQADPDLGVAVNKQLVYLIAFNQFSLEVFFDAGNATGSPLGNVQGSLKQYGCAHADSIQRIDDTLLWLCSNRTSSLQIMKMADLSLEIASTPQIDRLLADADTGAAPFTVMSWQVKTWGHSFYVITFKNNNLTLAYDLVEGVWSQWTDTNGNYLDIIDSTFTELGNKHIVQGRSAGSLMYMSSSYTNDDDDLIPVSIYTPIFDGQTRRMKQCNRLSIIADQVEGSTLQVRWSDDDYQTWTPFRDVDLGQDEPMLTQLGSFKKRAFHFYHKSNKFFRMSAVELQYDVGTI